MKKIAFLLMIIGAFAFAKSEEAPQKSEPKQLEMVLILDKSGSMSGLESDTIGGFNSMIDKQKEAGVDAKVTTVLFDTHFRTLQDIKKVEKLTAKAYVASGNTALLDAVGETINKISKVEDIYAKNRAVLFVIITDGQENSSKEYSKAQIKKKISDKQEKYDWEFIFLGANIDAASEAESIGIQRSNAVKYQNNSEGVQKNFEAAAEMSKDMAMDKKSSSKWREKVLEDK